MYIPSVDDRNGESWRLLVEERIANIFFGVFLFFVGGSLQTSQLYKVGELAG